MNTETLVCLIVGAAIVLGLAVCIPQGVKNWKRSAADVKQSAPVLYDERQSVARLKSFRNACIAMGLYQVVLTILYLDLDEKELLQSILDNYPYAMADALLLGVALGVLVFDFSAMYMDAFVSLRDKPKWVLPSLFFSSFTWGVCSWLHVLEHVEDVAFYTSFPEYAASKYMVLSVDYYIFIFLIPIVLLITALSFLVYSLVRRLRRNNEEGEEVD